MNNEYGILKIALTNLRKYTEGILNYEQLILPATEEEIAEAYKKIGIDINDPHADEAFITDYEWIGEFDGMDQPVNEYDSVYDLNELAEELEDHEDEADKILAMSEYGLTTKDILDRLDDAIFYPNMSLEDVAEEMVNEGYFGEVPKSLVYYIDFAAIARDLNCEGYTETSTGVIYTA